MVQRGGQGRRFSTVGLAKAYKKLAGARATVLDIDWLAVDGSGSFAIFLGDDSKSYRLPGAADAIATSTLIETLRALFDARPAGVGQLAYRSAARVDGGEPIFDVPRASSSDPLHEPRFGGYPHLFVAAVDGAAAIREAMVECGGHEVSSRGPFAASAEIGPSTYDSLHAEGACAGCRVLDLANDPRPRSPEVLASLGFFVYGYTRTTWLRIASPSVAADAQDLEALGASRMGCVIFTGRFDDRSSLPLSFAE